MATRQRQTYKPVSLINPHAGASSPQQTSIPSPISPPRRRSTSSPRAFQPTVPSPTFSKSFEFPSYLRRAKSDLDDEYEFVHKKDDLEHEFKLIPTHHDLALIGKARGRLHKSFPITFWLASYQWNKWLIKDAIAAITALVMLIPQGMGYALVAGLDVRYGLYSSLMGPLLYFSFGTCGQMSVAPLAIISLMTYETVSSFNTTSIEQYAAYASCLAFQVGLIQFALGFVGAGVLANMLAQPVIVGFTTAASVLIIMSQCKFIFNMDITGTHFVEKVYSMFQNIFNGAAHWKSVIMFVGFALFLFLLKKWKNSPNWKWSKQVAFIPGALIVVVIGTAISYVLGQQSGFDVIGDLQNGLPSFKNFLPFVGADFWKLFVASVLIALLDFIESYSVADKFGTKHDYHVDASQELIALGVCNVVGSWFQIYTIGGALSRCAVVEAAGALTPLHSAFSGILMLISCSFLLFLFEWLPKPCLASIVVVGASGLFDYKSIYKLWKVNKRDFAVSIITVLTTLFIGIDYGVALGVLASLVMFAQYAAKPHYGILGKVPNSKNIYRRIKDFEDAETRPDILIIRWDSSLFFANIESFQHRLRKQIGRFLDKNEYPKYWCLTLCFSGVNYIDSTAAIKLGSFFSEISSKNHGMRLLLAKLKTEPQNMLKSMNALDVIGEDHVVMEVSEAEDWWDKKLEEIECAQAEIFRQAVTNASSMVTLNEEHPQEDGLINSNGDHENTELTNGYHTGEDTDHIV